jgi:hypothetical protein
MYQYTVTGTVAPVTVAVNFAGPWQPLTKLGALNRTSMVVDVTAVAGPAPPYGSGAVSHGGSSPGGGGGGGGGGQRLGSSVQSGGTIAIGGRVLSRSRSFGAVGRSVLQAMNRTRMAVHSNDRNMT